MSRPKDESYDVSDSTDWKSTPLPSLAPVDSALRCQVCRDFYNTPMITSCSHTFCSLCIRHCLNNDAKCPTCRKGDQESKLRNNYALEELVDAFRSARPEVMEFAKRREEILSSSPKRKRVEAELTEDSSPVRKRTRAGRRAQQSSQQVVILDSEGDDEDFVPEEKEPGQIKCPICQDGFPTVAAVQTHVDHCNGEPPSKKRPRSTQTSLPPQPVSKANSKRPERLAQLNYSMVKDNALRKKLGDMGISTSGSRQLMERRYTEWVTLWNANCDSKIPKGKGELKRELDVWERTQGGGAPMASRINTGGNIRDKDFDGLAWSKNNDESFKQLVAEARKKKATKEEAGEPAKAEAASGTALQVPGYSLPYAPEEAAPAIPHHSGQQKPSESRPVYEISQQTDYLRQEELNYETIIGSPPKTSSQRRFFEDAPPPFEPPSSQHQSAQILDKVINISSDIATLRPLQP